MEAAIKIIFLEGRKILHIFFSFCGGELVRVLSGPASTV